MKINNVSVAMHKSIVYKFRDIPLEDVPYWCLYIMQRRKPRRTRDWDTGKIKTIRSNIMDVVVKCDAMTLDEMREHLSPITKEEYDEFLSKGYRYVAYPRKSRNVRPRRYPTTCLE